MEVYILPLWKAKEANKILKQNRINILQRSITNIAYSVIHIHFITKTLI